MKPFSRIFFSLKAAKELGSDQVGLNLLYRFGMITGHYHRQLSASLSKLKKINQARPSGLHPCLPGLPDRSDMLRLIGDKIGILYSQADEIVGGEVRLFGGQPEPLVFEPPKPLRYWTRYEKGNNQVYGQDIKLFWEPGRFGWACTLAMAYHLSGEERYANAFWHYTERFLAANPPYLGPHWSSAQEAAIRIVALAFAAQVFTQPKPASYQQLAMIAQAIAEHAERIPPTLVYARSQNNNHLITEALGLYTASAVLPDHPLAAKWHQLGWQWLQYALRTQIDPDGTYTQHSTNYHRLMLQSALWMQAILEASFAKELIPGDISEKLKATTYWLWKLADPGTGHVPNLGHNDGSYILPLTLRPYDDYRPVISAAAQMFLHIQLSPQSDWNDMSYWLLANQNGDQKKSNPGFPVSTMALKSSTTQNPHVILNLKNDSWAYFRVARYSSRPAHADQLHLDLWWRGMNVAQDPGTYLYNGSPPWNNALTSTFVHNTVTLDSDESMQRAGRFLYINWAQAKLDTELPHREGPYSSLTAQHDGYRKKGVIHQRKVSALERGRWEVIDRLDGSSNRIHTIRLHWLLPDWEYEIEVLNDRSEFSGYSLRIRSPFGWVSLITGLPSKTQAEPGKKEKGILVRAGGRLYGSGEISPLYGWVSPTYGEKIPALSWIFEITHSLPVEIKSEWTFPE